MLFREQPTDKWTDFDFMLVEALQILEDETCNECGQPIWICRNEEASNVSFVVKTSKCFANAELEKWRDKEQNKKNAKKRYGEYPYIVAETYDGSDLPTRASFYRAMMLKDSVE